MENKWEYRIVKCTQRDGIEYFKIQFRSSNKINKILSPNWYEFSYVGNKFNTLEDATKIIEDKKLRDLESYNKEIITEKIIYED